MKRRALPAGARTRPMLLRSSGGKLGGEVGGAVAGTDEEGNMLIVWDASVAVTVRVVFDEDKAELLGNVPRKEEK